jgi:chromosome segregation ATPase
VSGEARGILAAHEVDMATYVRQLGDAARRLERGWQRLQKLSPGEPPRPEEDIDQLTLDYQTWQATADAESNNPAVLADLATRQAEDLERRMEAARRQVSDGRETLVAQDKQYAQIGQTVNRARTALRSLQQDTQWQQINWALATGEEAWERAQAAQVSSRLAESLDLAANEMRRAVSIGQEAQQAYATAEQQLRAAQDRLNREYRTTTTELDRAQRRTQELRIKGQTVELAALEAQIASAQGLLGEAKSATTFDEALTDLRQAQEVLAR